MFTKQYGNKSFSQFMIPLPIILAGDKSQPMEIRKEYCVLFSSRKITRERIEEQFHTIAARPLRPHDPRAFSWQALSI